VQGPTIHGKVSEIGEGIPASRDTQVSPEMKATQSVEHLGVTMCRCNKIPARDCALHECSIMSDRVSTRAETSIVSESSLPKCVGTRVPVCTHEVDARDR